MFITNQKDFPKLLTIKLFKDVNNMLNPINIDKQTLNYLC